MLENLMTALPPLMNADSITRLLACLERFITPDDQKAFFAVYMEIETDALRAHRSALQLVPQADLAAQMSLFLEINRIERMLDAIVTAQDTTPIPMPSADDEAEFERDSEVEMSAFVW